MSAVFNKAGIRIPVTAVVADPNAIVEIRESKVVLGFGRRKKSKKTENAIVKSVGYTPRTIKEVSMPAQTSDKKNPSETPEQNSQQQENTNNKIKVGDKITVSIFKPGDMIKVTGTTKGRGFAGGVKRWGFAGGPKTHGQSDRHRAPGSIGAGTTPGRVFKGKKMAGHMGNARLTVTGLEVIEVDENKNLLLVKGAIPGAKSGALIIEKIGEFKEPSMTKQVHAEETPKEKEETAEKEKKETKPVTTENPEKRTESTEKESVDNKSESVAAKEEKNAG